MENCKGNILFVGEGDFSFSVAFARKFHKRDNQIISTCLLSQEELNATHSCAEENINVIKDIGVRVLHEVDATKLEECLDLKNLQFNYIIFNFPHTGGKSNIKNNRKLLKDFFPSAVQKLAQNGSILVSLARGQGGTPADQPVREWHDSWQVVAMAAYADLIMTDISPFSPSDWMEYSSTGFRGMDRNFFTGGAFTYEFKSAAQLNVGNYVENPAECCVDDQQFFVNSYIAKKLNRHLVNVEDHPIQLMCHLLESHITNYFDKMVDVITNLGYIQNRIVKLPDKNKSAISKGERKTYKSDVSLEDEILKDSFNCLNEKDTSSVDKDVKSPTIEEIESNRQDQVCLYYSLVPVYGDAPGNTDLSNSDLMLRSTLLDCLEIFNSMGQENMMVAFGDVYKRTWIESDLLPVQHEYVIILNASKHRKVNMNDKVKNILQDILPGTNVCLNLGNDTVPECYNKYMSITGYFEIGYKSENVFHALSCNQVGAKGPATTKRDHLKHVKLSKVVAYTGILKSKVGPKLNEINDRLVVVFNLDNMSQIKYDIPDLRLLWTENTEFIKQFVNHKHNDMGEVFKPLSYHPPLWRHDLSFWERDDEEFDEEKFLDLVRNIAGDAIVDVMLMNVWKDPETGQISKCYREVYQSQDSPISHQKAHCYQNAIRLIVEKIFRVQLR